MPAWGRNMKHQRLPASLVAIVMRQLSDALGAGLSLGDTLTILGKDTDLEKRHRQLVAYLGDQVAKGGALSSAFAQYPATFPPEAVALVRAGEVSGTLAQSLDLVAVDFELRNAHGVGLRGALAWPAAILTVLVVVIGVIMIFVIPSFKVVFASFGAELPAPTLVVIAVSEVFVRYWWVLPALFAVSLLVRKTTGIGLRESGVLDAGIMRIPFVRAHLIKTFVSRLSHILAHAIEGRLDVGPAITYLRATAGNRKLSAIAGALEAQLATGKDLVSAMRDTPRLPGQIAVALELGAKASSPGLGLRQVAAFCEDEALRSLVRLQQAIFVFVYICAGIVVGGTVIAMYLPIFQLGAVV